jgi:hypothetical protein
MGKPWRTRLGGVLVWALLARAGCTLVRGADAPLQVPVTC